MSNDRELIELAAKAAGYDLRWVSTRLDDNFTARIRNDNPYWFNWPAWNPLDDDGDALRLAGKLMMTIDISMYGTTVTIPSTPITIAEVWHEDATRRAIVRAAAAMAKTTA